MAMADGRFRVTPRRCSQADRCVVGGGGCSLVQVGVTSLSGVAGGLSRLDPSIVDAISLQIMHRLVVPTATHAAGPTPT
ncbi:hypothetical protein A5784_34210 [Mycobacterium sp. 852013-50091_SCH5140682]|nr:hypothetical protein A5784_34210 [Mycobacterium sp. 852013-50091_SCH5140682]